MRVELLHAARVRRQPADYAGRWNWLGHSEKKDAPPVEAMRLKSNEYSSF
jgi:hypothetical protein